MNDHLVSMFKGVHHSIVSSLCSGWTTAMIIDSKKLCQCCESMQSETDLYTGGIITQCSHDGKVVCQIPQDSFCRIPIVPIIDYYDSQSMKFQSAQPGSFFMTKIDWVAVSCIHIGKHKYWI